MTGDHINGLTFMCNGEDITNKLEVNISANRIVAKGTSICDNGNVTIKFAKEPYVEVNLFSSVGLPVKPFQAEVKA
ncbi:MAG: hypothetical protein PHE63_06585 [Eubacteriales bacterium]|jgi:hypothetical protein|nr:hypothetical protein [Eubacteriales bacterium]